MIPPRMKKIVSDFTTRWFRSVLTLAGLVIGIAAVIGISSAFVILSDDLAENYSRTNPHNVEGILGDLEPEQVTRLKNIPGVSDVEERRRVPARVELRDGIWFSIILYVVEDFNDLRIATFNPEAGAWPARDGEVLIERDGRFFLKTEFGAVLNIRLPDGRETGLTYVGQVHDPGQAPSRMERTLYGYVTRETYDSWSLPDRRSRVLMTVADANTAMETGKPAGGHRLAPGQSRVEFVANHLAPIMKYIGKEFYSASINDTTKQPHEFQMRSILGLLAGLLGAALVLCGALSVNLIDSILTAEVRNIGILKAIGARGGQILGAYLLGMGLLGGIAALIGLGFALDFGRGTAEFVARMVNFDLLTERNPVWLAPAMIGVGLAVPLALTAWRVSRAVRVPVRSALQNDGHIATGGVHYRMARMIGWLPLVPRMALRNLFRSPRRTLLTVTLVVIGLVAFLMAANIRSSLLDTVDAVQRSRLFNVEIVTRGPVSPREMDVRLGAYNEIEAVEYWNIRASRLLPLKADLGRGQPVSFVPAGNSMLVPDMMKGEWVSADRPAGIVVSNMIYLDSDDVEVGSVFELEVDGKRIPVTVIGVIKEFGGGKVYAPEALARELGIGPESANAIRIRLRNQSPQIHARFAHRLEEDLTAAGLNIAEVRTTSDIEAIVEAHIDMIAFVLEIVALVMIVVCTLGLASTTSVNVMERARETGILKAIGGRAGAVRGLFMWEAVFIALAGWGLALLIAPWPSRLVSTGFGLVLVQYPFNYEPAAWAIPAAGALSLAIALAASFLPAHAATISSVRTAVQRV